VRSELKGTGLGQLLLEKLTAYLRSQGTQRLVATVLVQNERMLKLALAQGFQEDLSAADEGGDTKKIFLPLTSG
jgi:acetyltransferase